MQNKQHTLAEQWICLRQVVFSKTVIYVTIQHAQRALPARHCTGWNNSNTTIIPNPAFTHLIYPWLVMRLSC